MGLPVKKLKSQPASKREKIVRYMELRGIADWIDAKLAMYYKPVASVPKAPNFVELMDLDVQKEDLMELLINMCAAHWDKEHELDEALAFLETDAGKKLADRPGDLSQNLNTAFDHYFKSKLDEKVQAFKRSTLQ
jgi:hypothetical protein